MQRQNKRVAEHYSRPNRLPRLRITVTVDITFTALNINPRTGVGVQMICFTASELDG